MEIEVRRSNSQKRITPSGQFKSRRTAEKPI